jgi:hypothetical protein
MLTLHRKNFDFYPNLYKSAIISWYFYHMLMNTNDLKLRPRFHFNTSMSRDEIVEKFRKELSENNPHQFTGMLTDFHIQIKFPAHLHKLWTPHMEINLEENLQDKSTSVRVLLAPVSTIWTLIVFLGIVVSTSIFIGLMLGVSQWMIEQEKWGFYIVGFGSIVLALLYLIARQGRTLSRKEMPQLKEFADQVFECDCMNR